MRLGGPVFVDKATMNPDSWVQALKSEGYRAAICPLDHESDDVTVAEYMNVAKNNDILIAEVGAWSNPISRDRETRRIAIEYCKQQLELADRIGARVCVNIAGSRADQWDGPHRDNFSDETFEMIVETTRDIIDAVKPTRTCFALETMPWVFPDTADSYLSLLEAIGRKSFGVHLDPVNMISSPRLYYQNGAMMKDFFTKLGPHIKSAHAKDILLSKKLTVRLDEVIPGQGELDYRVFLMELQKLDVDTPIIVEHLSHAEEYRKAASHIRNVAAAIQITL
jgi:sugar phosphate isomerase/epimerase